MDDVQLTHFQAGVNSIILKDSIVCLCNQAANMKHGSACFQRTLITGQKGQAHIRQHLPRFSVLVQHNELLQAPGMLLLSRAYNEGA